MNPTAKEQLDYKNKFIGSTSPPKAQIYTGNRLVGIATMHKSNLVPVFSVNAAKDIARMGKKG